MVPVPAYLKNHAQVIKVSTTWTSFSLSCDCGCRAFVPYINFFTQEEHQTMKPYYDALHSLQSGSWGSTCTKDADGVLHYWKLLSPDGLKGLKEEVILPSIPYFSGISAVKIKCDACGMEHLVFDSRRHGYSAITNPPEETVTDYQPNFRPKCKGAVGIEVKVENDPFREEAEENAGLQFSEEQYSNAFTWIILYAVNPDGKKQKIFDLETT